jgi:hypothetical protein
LYFLKYLSMILLSLLSLAHSKKIGQECLPRFVIFIF